MRRFLLLPALAAAVGLVAGLDRAAGQQGDGFGVLKSAPAGGLPTGIQPEQLSTSTERTPPNPSPLPAEAGPWLICAAHFTGFEGADLAKHLVEELRNKHHLRAWIYNRADEERRKQDEEWEQYKKRFPPNVPLRRKFVRIQDEWAVLVGDFKDFEAASKFLPRVKSLPIPDLKLADSRRCPFDVFTYQEMDPKSKQMVSKKGLVSPYHLAMAVRNPLTATNPQQTNWDSIWPKLNAYEDYSLLKNPKSFTLLVKKYSGGASITAGSGETGTSSSKGFLGFLGLGDSNRGEALNAAGAQAHELARFLRDPKRFGFDAYVLHTRTSSIVTVGAFSSPTDPELLRVKRQIANLKFSTDTQSTKTNPDPIGWMSDPIVILVPKP
jgi:hypothetical protein